MDEVHDEAEQLEHVISEDLERRIAAAMGDPKRDPHGELIPSAELIMPADKSIPLSSMQPGQDVVVSRVYSQKPGLLRHLEESGINPGGARESAGSVAFRPGHALTSWAKKRRGDSWTCNHQPGFCRNLRHLKIFTNNEEII